MNQNDLRVIKTKASINASLLKNLEQYPFEKISITNLTKEAKINRSTFYKYYLDKYDLLDQYLSSVLDSFSAKVDVQFVNAPVHKIKDDIYINLAQKLFSFFEENSYAYQVIWNAEIGRDIFEEMIKIIQHKIMDLLEHDIQYDKKKENYSLLYSNLFASNFLIMIRWWLEHMPALTYDELTDLMSTNMHRGLFYTFKKLI